MHGKIIYQSIIDQLLYNHSMGITDKVGSSAGGLGSINHAKWTRDELKSVNSNAKLMVLTDSRWCIDFQNSIREVFNGE